MKLQSSLLLSFLFVSSASFAAPMNMVCVAKHESSEVVFVGEGYKWFAAADAIKACESFAKEQGFETGVCKIISCESAIDLDMNPELAN